MNKNLKSEKGAITLIVLVTMLFLTSFLMTLYIGVANKSQTSTETTKQIAAKYNNLGEQSALLSQYIGDGDIIPIYTGEQFMQIGEEEDYFIINNKKYEVKENSIYMLMSDIVVNEEDYEEINEGTILRKLRTESIEQGTYKIMLERTNAEDIIFEKGKLPSLYEQVEYIESTGTQYIDTLYKPTGRNPQKVEFGVQVTQYGGTVFGSRGKNNLSTFAFSNTSSQQWQIGWWSSGNSANITVSDLMKHNIKLDNSVNGEPTFTIDETTYGPLSGQTGNVGNAGTDMVIFALRKDTTIYNFICCKLFYFKIYEDNEIIRDLIPCYRKSDGKPGLYDMIEGELYTNQGTGEFELPEKIEKINLPTGYQQVAYIENTSGSYIDTDVVATFPCNYVIKAQASKNTSSSQVAITTGWGYSGYWFGVNSSGKWAVGGGNEQVSNIVYSNKIIANVIQEKNESSNRGTITVNVNGETISRVGTTVPPNNKIVLFKGNQNEYPFFGKIYYFRYYDNSNVLSLDLVPCTKDGVAGLYDLCGSICSSTGTPFYTNSGTGDFIAGPEVN